MNTALPDDLHERILRLLDGEMSTHEVTALDAELLGSGEARALYFQLASLHSALECVHDSRSEIRPDKIIPIERFIRRRRRRIVQFVAVAAAILVFSIIPLWLKVAPSPESLARFETTPEAIFTLVENGEAPASAGQYLFPGSRLILSSGTLEATFTSGVRCVVKAPSDITIHSDGLIFLSEGVASVDVPPAAIGFTVQTKNLSVIDLGTTFGVIASRDSLDEIHVIDGHVEARIRGPKASDEKHVLKTGEARRIDASGNLLETDFSAASFATGLSQAMIIRNPSFDNTENLATNDEKFGYGPIPYWETSGRKIGINDPSQPFLDGQPPHSGTHVAFIESAGHISQQVSGFDPSKLYTVTYFVNEKGNYSASTRTSVSLESETSSYIHPDQIRKTDAFSRVVSSPFRVSSTSAKLEIHAEQGSRDSVLLIDSVSISRAVPVIPDGGFEATSPSRRRFAKALGRTAPDLKSSPWVFHKGSGIVMNDSVLKNPDAPEGSRVALFEKHGAAIENTILGVEPGVTYRLILEAAGREDGGAAMQVTLGGEPLRFNSSESFTPPLGEFQTFTSEAFQASAETLLLHIHSIGEGHTFLDDLRFEFIAEANR